MSYAKEIKTSQYGISDEHKNSNHLPVITDELLCNMSLYLFPPIYMYTYTCIYVYMCIYIYMYIYTHIHIYI
jgi:hypothetical protein